MQMRAIPSTAEPLLVIGCGTWQTFDVGSSALERAPLTEVLRTLVTGVGLLEVAKQLGNVSQAYQIMGYSRDSFYRFKELYETIPLPDLRVS